MKNLYLIQPSGILSNSVFLPYSAGTLAAYALSCEKISANFCLKDFIFVKEPIDDVLAKTENPFVAGFSCYMWNIEYNLVLAGKIKERYPECTIIFGGPQIPESTEYLDKYSFIDVLIFGEGELPLRLILEHLIDNKSFESIDNIAFRGEAGPIKTAKSAPCALDDFPSPYDMGLFDGIMNAPEYRHLDFSAIVETNRGCPYGCIYCYWARSGSAFRAFPMQRVKKDIEWLGKHNIEYCVCADGNFGILDRDEEIADYAIEVKQKYGFPIRFETAADKNKKDSNFRINRKLERAGLNVGVSLAVQTLSPKALEAIGRKNLSVERFSHELNNYRKHNINTYTDLMVGLPEETLESFCKSLFGVIEAGQHYSLTIHRCEVFPNTPIYSDEIREKYQIKTVNSQLCQKHSIVDKDLDFSSRSQVIVGTRTMTPMEWYTAERISFCAQSFHSMGLLRFFAVYLRKARNVSYYDFYMKLYDWIENKSAVVKRLLDHTCETFIPFIEGKSNLYFADERFGNLYWGFEEALYLCAAVEIDAFYDDVKDYLLQYFDDTALFDDLMQYQKEMIPQPSQAEKTIETLYDWHEYFRLIFDPEATQPEFRKTKLKIAKGETDNWPDYAKYVAWYGRRNGKSINSAEYVN
ncbi:MAG: B12-binding domain-containing radical SAM protein [Clostridia bacterium]|nr:B12-binding domain-containing radical SAM protein [Clostridia bacterium]